MIVANTYASQTVSIIDEHPQDITKLALWGLGVAIGIIQVLAAAAFIAKINNILEKITHVNDKVDEVKAHNSAAHDKIFDKLDTKLDRDDHHSMCPVNDRRKSDGKR